MAEPPGATPRVELHALVVGTLTMPESYAFRKGSGPAAVRFLRALRSHGPVLRSPCLAYALRHPTEGVILVDTGLHPDAAADLRRDFGRTLGAVFASLRPSATPYEQQLRALGVEPGDVRRVIMTHLHVDHTSGMRLLPGARFVCSRREWRAARRRGAVSGGYAGHHLPAEGRMELVDMTASGRPHGAFSCAVDLLGDGSVLLVATPGHTPGHLSVLLTLADGRRALLIGDAAYTLRNLDEERLPLMAASDDDYLRSLREIKAFAREDPDAVLVPSHDPSAWRRLAPAS